MNTEVISEFICCGKPMIIVKLEHGTHVMSHDEWKSIYWKLHPEKFEGKKRSKKRTA